MTKNVSVMWKDYAAAIGTTVDKLTKQQKIQAEVAGIMEETKFQTGDAKKAAGQYSGMIAALSASFYNLKVAVGNTIIPVIAQILPVIRSAIDQMTIFFNRLASFMSLLFNVKIGGSVDAMGQLSSETETAASAQEDLADATKKTEKAAKGALAAFDEINVLQQPDQAAGGVSADAAGSVAPALDTSQQETSIDRLKEKVDAFRAGLIEFFAPLQEPFENLRTAFDNLSETIKGGLKWAWENILVPLGEWVIQEVAPRFLELLATALDTLNTVLERLKPLGIWLWENFLKPLGEWAGEQILRFLDWFTARLKKVTQTLENEGFWAAFQEGLSYAWEAAKIVAGDVWRWIQKTWGEIGDWFNDNVTEPVKKRFAEFWSNAKETWSSLYSEVQKAWSGAGAWFDRTVTEPVKKFFSTAWNAIKGSASTAWTGVNQAWSGASAWFEQNVTTPTKNWFASTWDDTKAKAGATWANIQTVWGEASAWFAANVTGPIGKAFDKILYGDDGSGGIKGAWVTAFDGIREVVKGAINNIIDFLNAMIDAFCTGLNVVIGGLNQISFEVPSWVPGIGGSTWGVYVPEVSAPYIPKLATGAVIPPNAEFAAILGDQRSGTNIEAPESLLRQIVSEELGKIEAEITINVSGSLAALVREMNPYIQKENVRVGGSLVKGTVTI